MLLLWLLDSERLTRTQYSAAHLTYGRIKLHKAAAVHYDASEWPVVISGGRIINGSTKKAVCIHPSPFNLVKLFPNMLCMPQLLLSFVPRPIVHGRHDVKPP